ncbi:hypothetical protein [Paraclostridium sordellii]|uniref:hypothetical protein n=1 Tax=Paraclostridium sordellii TaxID=1505 RepID=UPI0018CE493B|nr:hypothetical protein [Paeniclostridium sordellii]
MALHEQRISIEKLTEDKIIALIDSFLSCGWSYNGNLNFNDIHVFASFSWNKEGTPIFPEGYEPCKLDNRIQVQPL